MHLQGLKLPRGPLVFIIYKLLQFEIFLVLLEHLFS